MSLWFRVTFGVPSQYTTARLYNIVRPWLAYAACVDHLFDVAFDSTPVDTRTSTQTSLLDALMCGVQLLENVASECLRNDDAVTLGDKAVCHSHLISECPLFPNFCGYFVPLLRPSIEDYTLKFHHLCVLLGLVSQYLESLRRELDKVQLDVQLDLLLVVAGLP